MNIRYVVILLFHTAVVLSMLRWLPYVKDFREDSSMETARVDSKVSWIVSLLVGWLDGCRNGCLVGCLDS